MALPKKGSKKESPERPAKRQVGRPRSPGRTKSPARTKSPGRPKSPGRSSKTTDLVKEKSPARGKDLAGSPKTEPKAEKSGRLTPNRRSPIRSRMNQDEIGKETTFRLRRQRVIEADTDSDTAETEKPEIKEKPKAAVRGRTRTDLIEIEKGDFKKEPSIDSTASTMKTRSKNREIDRIVHLKHFDTTAKKLAEFSDEDELIKEKASKQTSGIKSSLKSYDLIGSVSVVLLMLSLPLLVFYLNAFCTKYSCSFKNYSLDLSRFKKFGTFFNSTAYLGYFGYLVFLSFISMLPFGGKKVFSLPDKQEKFVYVMNGLLSVAIVILLVISLELKNFSLAKFIINHLFHLSTAAFLIGTVLSIFAYVRSFYVPVSSLNPSIVGKTKVYNFAMGRELHPRLFGRLDLKTFLLRTVLVSVLLINSAYVYQSLGTAGKPTENVIKFHSLYIRPTLLVYFMLLSTYVLDGLIFEHSWVTSKEVQQEGVGYNMIVGYLLVPFLFAFPIKYMVENNVELAYWKLALTSLVFLAGLILYRGSNSQKDAFRKNPYGPAFSKHKTIPTTQGKKLLCSGYWGFVRHPNYLGDILIQSSFVPFVLCVPPVLYFYLTIAFLVHRAKRDNDHCAQKYGEAWDRYCQKVQYLLVPKVY